MRAMDTAGQGLCASAVRRAYIPMKWGHCSVSFPHARSRYAALIHSHPCGGRMAYLMEREGRDSKGLGNRKVLNPFGTLVATRPLSPARHFPSALYKAIPIPIRMRRVLKVQEGV